MIIVYVVLGLFFVFLTKRFLTQTFARLVHRLGGGRRGTIVLWSVIFLPGTVIHEISHFLFAILTGARTGKIEVFPEYLDDEFTHEGERGVTLGYVQTSRLNPIQGFLVGLAPFFVGLTLLVWFSTLINQSFNSQNYYVLGLYLYLFFTVANSFFPSWADIKQTLTFVVLLCLALFLIWFWRLPTFYLTTFPFTSTFLTLSRSLFFASLLNLFLGVSLNALRFLLKR